MHRYNMFVYDPKSDRRARFTDMNLQGVRPKNIWLGVRRTEDFQQVTFANSIQLSGFFFIRSYEVFPVLMSRGKNDEART